jgi:cyclomaltodextrinase / maltogenic alpha-amylase / neopullulanase
MHTLLCCLALILPPQSTGSNPTASDWPPPYPSVPSPTSTGELHLPKSVEVERLAPGRYACLFRVRAESQDSGGALVGSFNGWDAAALPLVRQGSDWVARLELPEGRHSYKFVVAGRWFPDPQNPNREPDGYGGSNSLLLLGAFAPEALPPAKRLDARIEAQALAHDPQAARFVQRTGERAVTLRYRTQAGDVAAVWLATPGDGVLPLHRALTSEPFDWWELQLPEGLKDPRYTFVLDDGGGRLRHAEELDSGAWPPPLRPTPAWAKTAIWYQIMLDRFDNGDAGNDPAEVVPWKSAWYQPTPAEKRSGESFYRFFVFRRLYGGDLAGLERRLDYLRDLGVNALYLNPVFEADTHHKYNATNYLHIDQHFGSRGDYPLAEAQEDLTDPSTWTWTSSDQRFLAFLKLAKARGFRVIIDGVWNHVGVLHPAFKDVQQRGAESPYAEWFDISSFTPFAYAGWGGYGELPAFKKTPTGLHSAALVQHLYDVTRRWMDPDGDGDPSDGVDGWRLDVPNEIPKPFWVAWCQHVRSINPDAYISGEIWDPAPQWLDGQTFDAVMNYPFARSVYGWLAPHHQRLTPSQVDARLAELRFTYPSEVTAVLMNLVDSHDTDRLVSMLANPNRGYDQENREQDGAPYNPGKPGPEFYARARLAALLQMTYVGAPMIYYGDEVGMWGSDDPNNRRPMVWSDLGRYADRGNQVMPEHLEHYQALTRLRRDHPALVDGSFQTLLTDDLRDVWVFLRDNGQEQLLVAINASKRDQTVNLEPAALLHLDTAPFARLFGPAQPRALPTLRLPALCGLVLARAVPQ